MWRIHTAQKKIGKFDSRVLLKCTTSPFDAKMYIIIPIWVIYPTDFVMVVKCNSIEGKFIQDNNYASNCIALYV